MTSSVLKVAFCQAVFSCNFHAKFSQENYLRTCQLLLKGRLAIVRISILMKSRFTTNHTNFHVNKVLAYEKRVELLTIKTSCYVFPATRHVLDREFVAEPIACVGARAERLGILLGRAAIAKEMRITATTAGLRKQIHFVQEGDTLVFTGLAGKLKETIFVHV